MQKDEKVLYLKAFGENLRKLRQSKKLSQAEVYFSSELGKNAIGRLERGEVNPTITVIIELSKVLNVPLTDLVKSDIKNF